MLDADRAFLHDYSQNAALTQLESMSVLPACLPRESSILPQARNLKSEIYLNLIGETSLTAFLQGRAPCIILMSSKRGTTSQTGFSATFGQMAF